MKHQIFAILFLSLFFFSCAQKEQTGNDVILGDTTIIELGLQENTRTQMGPSEDGVRKVLWTQGDQVTANGCVSQPLQDASGSERGQFKFDALLNLPYNILYPAAFYMDGEKINLPASQQYAAGTFAPGTAPSVCQISSLQGASTLKNVCSVIQFRVLQGPQAATLQRLTFRGGNNEQVCGVFNLDYANAQITASSSADSTRALTLELGGLTLNADTLNLYVVVPAGTYEKGFSIELEDNTSKSMTITRVSSITLDKSKIIGMPAFSYDVSTDKVAYFDDYYETEMLFSGGKGTQDDPYLISSAQDLYDLSKLINQDTVKVYRTAHYKQVADINLAVYENFTPIAINSSYNFLGSYDGGGKYIYGLTINQEGENMSALFGACGTNASLSNINLSNVEINTNYAYAASLVGYAYRAKITNCHASGNISSTGEADSKSYTAGLVGRVYSVTATNCSFKGNVTATSNHAGGVFGSSDESGQFTGCVFKKGSVLQCNYYAGGIVASANGKDGLIKSCVCEGRVVAKNWNSGGITAAIYQGTIDSCVQSNTSTVESSNYNVGGIVGSTITNSSANDRVVLINNCATYGVVKGLYQVGGICGVANPANAGEKTTISNCAVIGAEITASGVNSYNYSLAAGICGWQQGNGNSVIVNCYSRPTFVNSTNANAVLGTSAISGYINTTTHTIDNCYTPVSPAEIQFRGAPVTSSSLVYYGSVLGRASAAVTLSRCYYNQALRFGPGTSDSNHTAASCAGYTLSQMTSTTLLNKLNAGLTAASAYATPSTWVMGSDSYPTLEGLPADTQPKVVKKRVSIIGDSISTFSGWIASTKINGKACTTHYPNTSNTACDVLTVDKTWWYRLIYNKMKNAQFEMNISSGNTTVVKNTTATSYSSQYWYNWDFCTRFIGYGGVGNPDVILIHGGTNDFGHMASYGATEKLIGSVAMDSGSAVSATQLQPLFNAADACTTLAQAEALDFTTFCSSYIKLMQMIKVRYPKAKVVCIIGDALKPGMQSAIRAIATHYNAKYVDFLELCGFKQAAPLSKYDNAVHPDAAGMEYMAKTIYSQVGAWMEE